MNSSIKTSVLLQVTSGTDTATVFTLPSWGDTTILVDVPSKERVPDMALAQYGDGKSILMPFFHIGLDLSMHRRFALVMLTC